MTDFIIREAVPDDAAAIIAYLHELFDEPNNMVGFDSSADFTVTVDEERNVLQRNLDADSSAFIVAVSDTGEVISVGNLVGGKRRSNRHVAQLGISVRSGWRERGVGKAVMQYMINWARDTGIIKRIELDVFAHNTRAVKLYEKLGFVIEGRKQQDFLKYEEYIDTLIMALLLQD